MKRKHKAKSREIRNIALERIKTLFRKARATKDKELADRYVYLARRISMKAKIRIPSEFKRQFCKHCYSYLKQGVNCRVRLQKEKVVYYCFNCKKYMRFPYVKELKAKRKFPGELE